MIYYNASISLSTDASAIHPIGQGEEHICYRWTSSHSLALVEEMGPLRVYEGLGTRLRCIDGLRVPWAEKSYKFYIETQTIYDPELIYDYLPRYLEALAKNKQALKFRVIASERKMSYLPSTYITSSTQVLI